MSFAAAIDRIFTDPVISVSATYLPAAGGTVAVRVIRSTPPQVSSTFQTRTAVPAYAAEVRVSEVAQPVEGDRLTIGSDTFTVRKWLYDGENLTWQLDMDKE